MNILNPAFIKVLSVMLSTDEPHYAAELADKTGISEQYTYKVLTALRRAGIATAREEEWGTYAGRAPRKFHELTEPFLNTCRVTPLSSISLSSI